MAKILIVDDDDDFRDQAAAALTSQGYEVVQANSGTTGLEAAKRELPDMILSDLMMETPDAGMVLCSRLKRTPETKHIPILMMTAVTLATGFSFGLDTPEQREWIKADDYVDKPITIPDLLKRTKRLLELHPTVE